MGHRNELVLVTIPTYFIGRTPQKGTRAESGIKRERAGATQLSS